jgi:hypothetical protein
MLDGLPGPQVSSKAMSCHSPRLELQVVYTSITYSHTRAQLGALHSMWLSVQRVDQGGGLRLPGQTFEDMPCVLRDAG